MTAIALGTVQFGIPYGIANTEGQVSEPEARDILSLAAMRGIHSLDTAIAYGTSEEVLGHIGMADWQIVTKLPGVPDGVADVAAWVEQQVQGSLTRLGVTSIEGLLLHRPSQLLEHRGPALYAALCEQRDLGHARRIGISIYDPTELAELTPPFHFDIVQAPLNILDARLGQSRVIADFPKQGTALHVRSVFLQGLLLMHSGQRPAHFAQWLPIWTAWDAWLSQHSMTPLQACLRYVLTRPGIEQVILGVNSVVQLQQILEAVDGPLPGGYEAFQTNDAQLLNPALWKSE